MVFLIIKVVAATVHCEIFELVSSMFIHILKLYNFYVIRAMAHVVNQRK
jgi:hypothetical protein